MGFLRRDVAKQRTVSFSHATFLLRVVAMQQICNLLPRDLFYCASSQCNKFADFSLATYIFYRRLSSRRFHTAGVEPPPYVFIFQTSFVFYEIFFKNGVFGGE